LKLISFDFLETAEYKENIEERLKHIASTEGYSNIDKSLVQINYCRGKNGHPRDDQSSTV
ncbi:hypothetical protein, partial [Candidatus Skiveiella danica]|uniref:hypothetical protein n=1 Tax=Candidatus Skiveiella danica TaxID=3386177 RepID=UPI0039B94DE6